MFKYFQWLLQYAIYCVSVHIFYFDCLDSMRYVEQELTILALVMSAEIVIVTLQIIPVQNGRFFLNVSFVFSAKCCLIALLCQQLTVIKDQSSIKFLVDNEEPLVDDSAHEFDVIAPIYVGGVPRGFVSPTDTLVCVKAIVQ